MENNIEPIQWVEETVPLSEIKPYERNPRDITEPQYARLKASLIKLGQFRPLLVNHEYKLMGGHQRLRAMQEMGWKECRVSVPHRDITHQEYKFAILADNHNNGTWNFDIMADDFDLEEVRAVGVHEAMKIMPMPGEEEDEETEKPKGQVKCPNCDLEFPTRGNKA